MKLFTKKNIFAAALLCCVVLHGCVSIKNDQIEKQYYNFQTDISSGSSLFNQGYALVFKRFTIDPAFDSHVFIYRTDTSRYRFDYYNEFINSPARLISDKLSELIYLSDSFKPISPNRPNDTPFRLSGKIIQLYGDVQNPRLPRAVIKIRILLEQKHAGKFTPVLNKTYKSAQVIYSETPDHLIQGWSTGLSQIAGDFINDFKQR